MAGFFGFAPIYLNGVLAVLFVLVLPGVVFVRALNISNFPQRWFAIFLSSLAANHFLVTLIAALHLQPLQAYRVAAVVLIAAFILLTLKARAGRAPSADPGRSTILLSDIFWFVLTVVLLGLVYFNVWKRGVPNIFEAGDVSVSWNTWALIWAQGQFPIYSVGYQQFVPTIWAVTYIFTGSTEQYFAFYIYLSFIVVPVVLSAMSLGRLGYWQPLVPCIALAWLVAEIRNPWLRACLEQGFPDWVATIFAFCGVVLFVSDPPEGRYNREKIITALISLGLVSIAAATKPQYGVFTAAVLIALCIDAVRYLPPSERTKLIAVAVGLVSAFAVAYVVYYQHIAFRRIPDHSLPISEKLSQALALFNSNFTLPFRIVLYSGVAISPFVPRVRWLSLPLIIGISAWAFALSYDLRNLIGFLLVSAFIPLFVLARAFASTRLFPLDRRWRVPDGGVVCCLALLCIGLSLSLAKSDEELKRRFAAEQLVKGAGLKVNQKIEQLLRSGCTIINADDYLFTISAFQQFKDKMPYFHFEAPITDGLKVLLDKASGCTGIIYPFNITHSSILSYVSTKPEFAEVVEDKGWMLRVANSARGGS
ncbi:hypothetical protein [Bradyrhizobium sp.]|uniref:hypothetical protein n=1 Tax=Bradyrhizobium sp. TaxID=376 RepID=UPI0040383FDC